jgi:hypothetical protein
MKTSRDSQNLFFNRSLATLSMSFARDFTFLDTKNTSVRNTEHYRQGWRLAGNLQFLVFSMALNIVNVCHSSYYRN